MSEQETKERDVKQVVAHLTRTFNQATSKMERPFRGKKSGTNSLYRWQSEFAYLLNEVMQGPRALLPQNIIICNEYIDSVIQLQQEQEREE